jgi:hypothetical protein
MVIERKFQNKKFKLNGIFLINSKNTILEITELCRSLTIIHNQVNIFASGSLLIQTEESIYNFLEEGDKIRVSYVTGYYDEYFDTREFLFKIKGIPACDLEKSSNIQVLKLDLVDHRLYDMMYNRYNITFVNKSKSEILTTIFKNYNIDLNIDISDIQKYTYYCKRSNILEDINTIRYLGDEPLFIFERNNDKSIYVRDYQSIIKTSSVFRFDLTNVIGTNNTENINSLQGTFKNVYDGSPLIPGYIHYSFDVDNKNATYTTYSVDDDFYPIERINNIKMIKNSLYKENYYMLNTLGAKYNYTNTNLKLGDVVDVKVSYSNNSNIQTSFSGKYFIYAFDETINFENLLIEQNFVLIK